MQDGSRNPRRGEVMRETIGKDHQHVRSRLGHICIPRELTMASCRSEAGVGRRLLWPGRRHPHRTPSACLLTPAWGDGALGGMTSRGMVVRDAERGMRASQSRCSPIAWPSRGTAISLQGLGCRAVEVPMEGEIPRRFSPRDHPSLAPMRACICRLHM